MPHLKSGTDTSYFPTEDLDGVPMDTMVDHNAGKGGKDLAFLGYSASCLRRLLLALATDLTKPFCARSLPALQSVMMWPSFRSKDVLASSACWLRLARPLVFTSFPAPWRRPIWRVRSAPAMRMHRSVLQLLLSVATEERGRLLRYVLSVGSKAGAWRARSRADAGVALAPVAFLQLSPQPPSFLLPSRRSLARQLEVCLPFEFAAPPIRSA